MKKITICLLGLFLAVTMALPNITAFASVETGDIEMPFNMDIGVFIKPIVTDYDSNFVITYPSGGIRIAVWYDSGEFSVYITQGAKSKTVTFKAPYMGFLLKIYYMPAPYNGMYPNISIFPIESNNQNKAQKLFTSQGRLVVDGQEKLLTRNDDGFYYYNIDLAGFFVGTVTADYVISGTPTYSIVNNTRPQGTYFTDWTGLYNFWYDQTKYFAIPGLEAVDTALRSQYSQGYNKGYENGFNDGNNGVGDFWQGAVYTIRTFGNALSDLGNMEIAPKVKLSYIAIGIPVLLLIVNLIFRNRGD